MTTFTNVKDFQKFLKEKNINDIHEFLQKFTVNFHKPEYASNSVFTNKNGAYQVSITWFAEQVAKRMLGYTDFIEHFRKTLQSESFHLQIKEVA